MEPQNSGRWQSILQKLLASIRVVIRIEALGPCWEWTGSTGGGRNGEYPRMSLEGHTVAAHRVSFVQFNGFLSPKRQVDHLCCNTICINPAHLESVSHRENQRRKVDRAQRSTLRAA